MDLRCCTSLFKTNSGYSTQPSPSQADRPDVTYGSPTAPYLHLISFAWYYLHSHFHLLTRWRMGWHRRGRAVRYPWRNSARPPNKSNPFRCTARHCNERLFPPGAPKMFMQSRRVGMKIQSDGTQTVLSLVLLLFFFLPSFSLF